MRDALAYGAVPPSLSIPMHSLASSSPGVARLNLLIAPFERLGTRGMAMLTVLQAVAGLAFSHAGVRFDGAMDVHRTAPGGSVSIATAVLDQCGALVVAAIAMFAVLRLAGIRSTVMRALLIVGTARVALLLAAVAVVWSPPVPSDMPERAARALLASPQEFVLAGLLGLVALVWFIALMANGVRYQSARSGWRLFGLTVAVLLVAESVSKAFLAATA